jgi:hypothetical protein
MIIGTLNSFASALTPDEISEISSWRFSFVPPAAASEQLQVINHDKLDVVLRFQAA